MVRHMVLFVVLLFGMSALGQTSPTPMPGTFECYTDSSTTGDYYCMSSQRSLLDITATLHNMDVRSAVFPSMVINGNGRLTIESALSALDTIQPIELPYDTVDCDNANGNPNLCMIEPDAPEPVDVPAVFEVSPPYPPCQNWGSKHEYCFDGNGDLVLHFLVETCADKSRVLEHDENTPPTYWCHKVQP